MENGTLKDEYIYDTENDNYTWYQNFADALKTIDIDKEERNGREIR